MKAYDLSTTTLRSILQNPLLDMKNIDKTREELAEAIDDQAEIDAAVRMVGNGVGVGSGEDEEELERELKALVDEERVEQERNEEKRKKGEERSREEERIKEAERQQQEVGGGADQVITSQGGASNQSVTRRSERVETDNAGVTGRVASRGNEETGQEERRMEAVWEERYYAARRREREEKQRAESERMRRDEARLLAE